MFKKDDIYHVLYKYDFDLFRGNKGIREYMDDHLKKYYSDIEEATKGDNPFLGEKFVDLLRDKLAFLKEICKEIPAILELYDDGFLKEAYMRSDAFFDKVQEEFIIRFSWPKQDGCFYRIRQGDFRINNPSDSKEKKKEMFHIKKELRNRIGAYRYSVAGYPCLYLASHEELAWFECGMPKKFSYCQMLLEEDGVNALKLIDFSNRPVDFLSIVDSWLISAKHQSEAQTLKKYDVLLRYIMSYPLAAACSVKVKDRGNKFVEEYIFPQLLMQWIRKNDKVDGVRYKSSLNTNLVRYMGAINVALPVKKFREDGLDERLTQAIAISDIGYFDVSDEFCKYEKVLKEIEEFKNRLFSYAIDTPVAGLYVMEIIEMCECVIKTYTAIMEDNYTNSELIFSHLGSLYEHADLLYKSCDMKIQQCIDRALPHEKEEISQDTIREHFREFHDLMSKILSRNAVFEFQFENLENHEKL